MAEAASAQQAASATAEDTSQQRAGRRRRTSPEPQRAQQGATAAAAPAALDTLSRLQQLADASPQAAQLQRLQALADASPQAAQLRRLQALVDASPQAAQLRRLQALADAHYAPVAQLASAPEEEERVQGQFANAELEPQLQQAPRANNTGLPDQLKSGIESLSGLSMDHVRVHYNSAQPAQLNALAYAQGSDIHLAPGQERHLPHEVWHVVQQVQGRVRPTLQLKDGVPANDDVGLEREADAMGARAMQLSAGTGTRQGATADATRQCSRATAGRMKSESGEVAQLLMTAAAFQASTQTGLGALMGAETRPADVRALDAMITNYHALPAPANQADAHARLAALHQIQTSIHQHFNQQRGLHDSGHRAGMLALLDDVRAEHQAQIQQLVANNFAPWVPNRATLPAADVAAMDVTWANVTNPAGLGGQLAISDQAVSVVDGTLAAVPGFRDEMHAHLARLLHTDTGRRLLVGLDTGPHGVRIEPTYRGMPRAEAEGMVKAYGAEQPGLDQETPGGLPGVGSRSVVRMLPGATDHEMVDFNAQDEPILSPAHIGVGHELIHALHNQRGVAWAANTHTPALYAPGGARAHYHNPEEYHTIAHPPPPMGPVPLEQLTENMLRAESNLPAREGHTGGRLADVLWNRWSNSWLLNGARIRP